MEFVTRSVLSQMYVRRYYNYYDRWSSSNKNVQNKRSDKRQILFCGKYFTERCRGRFNTIPNRHRDIFVKTTLVFGDKRRRYMLSTTQQTFPRHIISVLNYHQSCVWHECAYIRRMKIKIIGRKLELPQLLPDERITESISFTNKIKRRNENKAQSSSRDRDWIPKTH